MAKLVVVDPGHGGSDPGAGGHGLREATLTLTLAKRLRAALLRDFDVRVELTRSTDRAVALKRRATFANDLRADYFVSVHINSGGGTGYEDFVHSSVAASSKAAKRRSALHATARLTPVCSRTTPSSPASRKHMREVSAWRLRCRIGPDRTMPARDSAAHRCPRCGLTWRSRDRRLSMRRRTTHRARRSSRFHDGRC